MKELINDHINLREIKRLLGKVSANELSQISQPCYVPQLKKHFYQLLSLTNITEKELKIAVKNYWKGNEVGILETDIYTNLLIFYLYLFLQKRDTYGFDSTMRFHVVRQYSGVFYKFLPKYCDPDVFRYTLDNLTKTHIFYTKETIGSALLYFSNELKKRWTPSIRDYYKDPKGISKFIRESRGRINQSFRSFANSYHYNAEHGLKISQSEEYNDQVEDKTGTSKFVDDMVKNITVYRIFNHSAYDLAYNATKADRKIGKLLIVKMMNPKYTDLLILIYNLFLKDIKHTSTICNPKDLFKIIKKLLSIKKSNKQIYFKQQMIELLISLFKDAKMEKAYKNYSDQTKFVYLSFLTFYLILILRKNIC